MALFAFVDLREGVAAPSAELADLLEVNPGDRLLGRRLRGVGMWDLGRELFEIVLPDRLPADPDYTADAGLGGVLDFQARGLPYGESYVELRKRLGAYESLILHGYVDGPDAAEPTVHEPIALVVFWPAGWQHRAVSRLWRCAHGWATRRPRPQQISRVGPPPCSESIGSIPADPGADDIARVVVNPAVMGGVPCIRGNRIPVVTVLRTFAGREDPDSVFDDFPELAAADIRAAVHFAADVLDPDDSLSDEEGSP